MRFFKGIIVCILAMSMIGTAVYAEEAETGSSDVNVKVVRQVGQTESVLYTGALSGYENGAFSEFDLSENDIIMIFDWNSSENEIVYIQPVLSESASGLSVGNNTYLNSVSGLGEAAVNSVQSSETNTSAGNVSADIKILYNDEYYEKVLLNNANLNVLLSLANTGTASKELACYIAEYNSSGRLTDVISNGSLTVPGGETIAVSVANAISDTAESAKIFLWEKGTMKPVVSAVLLHTQQEDYYADDFTAAENYDISKIINGKINNTSDVDYIKFKPSTSGQYIISAASGVNVNGSLYNEQGTLVASGSAVGGGYYIKEELSAGNTYYLKTTGESVGDYSIAINQESDMPVISAIGSGFLFKDNITQSNTEILLYSSAGELLQTKGISAGNNASCSFEVNTPVGDYVFAKRVNGDVINVYQVKVLKNEQSYSALANEKISVPVIANNVTSLKDIYFSVVYDTGCLEIADVSDITKAVEIGTGSISSALVEVHCVSEGNVSFESVRSLTESWSGMVNSVKLSVKEDCNTTVTTFVCVVE